MAATAKWSYEHRHDTAAEIARRSAGNLAEMGGAPAAAAAAAPIGASPAEQQSVWQRFGHLFGSAPTAASPELAPPAAVPAAPPGHAPILFAPDFIKNLPPPMLLPQPLRGPGPAPGSLEFIPNIPLRLRSGLGEELEPLYGPGAGYRGAPGAPGASGLVKVKVDINGLRQGDRVETTSEGQVTHETDVGYMMAPDPVM
ncbi:MAG: hypothetical protein ACHQRJ_03760 [Alphaproteobacteria bacterium]